MLRMLRRLCCYDMGCTGTMNAMGLLGTVGMQQNAQSWKRREEDTLQSMLENSLALCAEAIGMATHDTLAQTQGHAKPALLQCNQLMWHNTHRI